MGALDTMLEKRNCSVDSCGVTAISSLDRQDFCLDHFICCCYGQLESLDPRGRKIRLDATDLSCITAFIEDCSRKALDISLRYEALTNLQRGRLLDILLWAGEILVLLGVPRLAFSESIVFGEGHVASRAARGQS
jgi:hypothetical protein